MAGVFVQKYKNIGRRVLLGACAGPGRGNQFPKSPIPLNQGVYRKPYSGSLYKLWCSAEFGGSSAKVAQTTTTSNRSPHPFEGLIRCTTWSLVHVPHILFLGPTVPI